MLNRTYRLKKNYQFSYIYKKGDSVPSKHLVLIFAKAKNSFKIGFSVSNKTGKAVVRNKLKRRLRDIARIHLGEFVPGFHYIILARSHAAECSYEQLETEMIKLIRSAGKKITEKQKDKMIDPVSKDRA